MPSPFPGVDPDIEAHRWEGFHTHFLVELARAQYLRKRTSVLRSRAHLVELDLLRGGQRLPMRTPLPPADYFAIVSRSPRRPAAEVFAWTIRQPLPSVPIPLAGSDPDVLPNLQAVMDAAYDGMGYDYALDYSRPVVPPLCDADLAWARRILSARAGQEPG